MHDGLGPRNVDLQRRPLAQQAHLAGWNLRQREFLERVDRVACNAQSDGSLGGGKSCDHGELVERALIYSRAEVHRLREIFRYEKIVDRKIVAAGPAQALDSPRVEDFHIRG